MFRNINDTKNRALKQRNKNKFRSASLYLPYLPLKSPDSSQEDSFSQYREENLQPEPSKLTLTYFDRQLEKIKQIRTLHQKQQFEVDEIYKNTQKAEPLLIQNISNSHRLVKH